MALSRRSGAATALPQADQQLKQRMTRVCGLVEALMFDLAAWLAGADRPVTPELNPAYMFNELRRLPRPRDRMSAYLSEELLESWAEVIERWLTYGANLQPYFGRRLALVVEGLDGAGPVSATLRFPNQSTILIGSRRQYCRSDWELTVEISSTLKRIESCLLRPASDGTR